MLPKAVLDPILRQALAEDIGPGDVTTAAVLTGDERGQARAIAKSDLVVAGADVFREVFTLLDASLEVALSRRDGDRARPGDSLAELTGRLGSILTAERTALNFFQRLCGIATLTRRFVEEIDGTGARILDTRKTAPGLRLLDKYAVRVGGGRNHRFALFDGVLIKDNHIAAAGGIAAAVAKVHQTVAHLMKIEVECKNAAEVEEALAAGADAVMLDNMDLPAMREAVALVRGRVPLEASGNVTLANVRRVAETGVDFISVGALTHSVAAADISLNIQRGT
ncbi:MAG TPA: carboxylating nicotinate-nucleotide diphosphorylase [Syntrophus sp. (in: bacteria)]|nr:carboxylating nicotinate-nucleotide diphosphorylase [Syntrophus sp. (in: bacteria)]